MTLALMLLIGLWAATLASHRPTGAPPADGSQAAFSAARAMSRLQRLVGDSAPHPIGTAANAAMRARILQQLRALGYEPEVQSGFLVCSDEYATCGMPSNIVARLAGTEGDNSGAVLVAAHYDSVPGGPGASDDGAGVASVLEIARDLKFAARTRHSIVLLLDDAEEAGLLGARLFVQHHRWSARVRAAVNIDNRGTRGSSFLYETGSSSTWLMRLYAQAIPRPFADSVTDAVFARLPPRTDFSVFKAAGYQGFNFAYVGGSSSYHTPRDDVRHADMASIQQQGQNALATLVALANADIDQPPVGTSVYFDLFGRTLVRLPEVLMLPTAAVAALLIVVVAALLVRRRNLTVPEIGRALLGLMSAAAGSVASSAILLALLEIVAPAGMPKFCAYPAVLNATSVALAGGIIAAMSLGLHGRVSFWGLWCANALASVVTAAILAATLRGASYLPLLPGLVALAALAMLLLARSDSAWRRDLATLAYLAVMFCLLWPFLVPIDERLGTRGLLPLTCWLVLGSIPIAGLLLQAGKRALTYIGVTAAALTALGFMTAIMMPAYTADSPQPVDFRYEVDRAVQDETAHALWLVTPASGRLPDEIRRLAGFRALTRESFQPLLQEAGAGVFAADAPDLGLPAPVFRVLSTTMEAASRTRRVHIRAQFQSARGAQMLEVAFPPAAKVGSMSVSPTGDSRMRPVPVTLQSAGWGWGMLRLKGLPAQGVELSFNATDVPFDVALLDESYGLPAPGRAFQRARPVDETVFQDGDVTAVATTEHLAPAQ